MQTLARLLDMVPLTALLEGGVIVLAPFLVALAIAIVTYSRRPIGLKRERRSRAAFAFGAISAGVIGGVGGFPIGVVAACAIWPGEFCGLPGMFVGPLVGFYATFGLYLYYWAMFGLRSNKPFQADAQNAVRR